MRLDQADRIMLGEREVSRVYLGANLVWGNVFSPASLFAQGEPGVWYEPSDFSTMFQNSAGTTPVTAVEQPVGLMLDKSGRGNHAYQPTTTSRPVLSARVNLLTKTEQFNDGVWSKNNATVTANAGVAPDGTTTADLITPATGTAFTGVDQYYNNTVSAAHTLSVYVKANGANFVQLLWNAGLSYNFANFDLSTGAVTAGVYTNATITSRGDGWFRCTITSTLAISFQRVYINVIPTANSSRGAAYTGDGNSGIYIWGASLVPADQADIPYQRVNTATDYDTAGFPHYLRFDGVDDWLVTNTITPGIDKVQVFAGVRKLSDAAAGAVAELSANINSNNGAFYLFAPAITSPSGDYAVASRGSVFSGSTTARYAVNAPDTSTVTLTADIAGDLVALRTNGVSRSSGTGDQGTGNYLAYPLYIGRRAGTSLPFNGRLYSLIVRFGNNLPIETIEQTEAWINGKTGAY